MKKLNKKGFTIVELVIVIAVIAILAAVMIPTFSGIVNRANESAALQEATNTYKALLTEDEYNGNLDLNDTANAADLYIKVTQSNKNYYFKVVDGDIALDTTVTADPTAATAEADGYNPLTGDYANVFVFTEKTGA